MEALEQTLRSALTPLTHNLPQPIERAATELLGKSCYRSLVRDLTISDSVCMKLAVSKVLGVGIIAASSIVKIPQLLKLLNSQSAEGVSFLSYLLETSAYLISLAYNARNGFPFSTYGETALITVQNIAISVLVLRYSGQAAAAVVFLAGLGAAGYAMYDESVVPMPTLQYLQAGANVLGVASKLPQILTVFREGGTGQLSAFAVFNYLLGSLTRIFTTLQEVDDNLILYGFVAGFALNAVLALQMLYYWNAPASKNTEQKTLTAAGKKSAKDALALPAASNGKAKGGKVASEKATPSGGKTKGKNSTPSTRRRG